MIASEQRRLQITLARLRPHLDLDRVALTGGVAVELHLARAGRPARRTAIADLDFIALGMGAVAAAAARDFLVSHYHTPQPGVPKGLIQLVDPVTRLRIDVFTDPPGSIAGATCLAVAGIELLVLAPRAILEHKLRTLETASKTRPVEAKHWLDAVALAELCGREPPPEPQHLAEPVYCTDLRAACARCELSRLPEFRSRRSARSSRYSATSSPGAPVAWNDVRLL